MGRYDELIAVASGAQGSSHIRSAARTSIANALILRAGSHHGKNPSQVIAQLFEAVGYLQEKPEHSYAVKFWKSIGRLLCRELFHLIENVEIDGALTENLLDTFNLIQPHFFEFYENRSPERLQSEALPILSSFQKVGLPNRVNPFLSSECLNLNANERDISERLSFLEGEGYEILEIFKMPRFEDFAQFVFANNARGERFYVHSSQCPHDSIRKWEKLNVGSKLAARNFRAPRSEREYPTPTEVVLV
jgi:hypothetical protein